MKKKFVLLILIALAIVLTGCTIPIIKKEVRMPWEKKPEEVLKTSFENGLKVKSFHSQTNIKLEIDSPQLVSASFNKILANAKIKTPKVLGEEITQLIPDLSKGNNANNQNTNTAPSNTNTNISQGSEKITFDLTGEGDVDMFDANNTKLGLKFDGSLNLSNLNILVGGELKSLNNVMYLKIDKIPTIPMLNQGEYAQLLEEIIGLKGTWIKIDPEEIQKYLLQSFGGLMNLENFSEDLIPQVLGEDLNINSENLNTNTNITNTNTANTNIANVNTTNTNAVNTNTEQDFLKKYQDLFDNLRPKIEEKLASCDIYSFQKLLTSEKINGVNSYHYKVGLNKTGLKQCIANLAKLYIEKLMEMGEESNSITYYFNEEQIDKTFDEIFKYIEKADGEVWIGKDDLLLYKSSWNFVFADPESKDSGKVKLDMTVNMSDFDTQRQISEPEKSKSIIDIYQEIMAKSSGITVEEMQGKQRDGTRLSDTSQVKTALILYFDDNQKYPQKLDDLVPDYISNIPANPAPGGIPYTYEPSKDLSSFKLSFVLETGNSSYAAGLHVLVPEGLDYGTDTDSDGLTDDQENYFGTDINKPDTDGDGFKDGDEVENGYNPNGTGSLELTNYKFGQ